MFADRHGGAQKSLVGLKIKSAKIRAIRAIRVPSPENPSSTLPATPTNQLSHQGMLNECCHNNTSNVACHNKLAPVAINNALKKGLKNAVLVHNKEGFSG